GGRSADAGGLAPAPGNGTAAGAPDAPRRVPVRFRIRADPDDPDPSGDGQPDGDAVHGADAGLRERGAGRRPADPWDADVGGGGGRAQRRALPGLSVVGARARATDHGGLDPLRGGARRLLAVAE